jgi:threonine dehydrogenase-like Zn-dependent dehydrogenase
VLLVGAGRLGQLIAQTLALTGCDLHVAARHPYQQDLLSARGIRSIAEADIQPRKWDIVVEATGSPDGFNLARKAIRPRGTLVMKSTYKGEMNVNFSSIVVDEIHSAHAVHLAPALRLLEKHEVDLCVDSVQYKWEKSSKFRSAARSGVLKVLVEP